MQQQHRFSHWLSCSLALLLCLMVGLALPVRPVQAATVSVTNTNDSGPGSLRQAIADAAPGDTITFALPNPSVITLNSELVIAKNLTISGPGTAALTISGNSATRVFFINPGASGATSGPPATSLAVTIANLMIANGRSSGGGGGCGGGGGGGAAGMGGGLFVNHANIRLEQVAFQNNQALGGGGGGAGCTGGTGGNGGGVGPAGSGGALGGAVGSNVFGANGGAGGEGAGGGGGGCCSGELGGNGGFGGGGGGGACCGSVGTGGSGGFGAGGGGGGGSTSGGAGGASGSFGGVGGSQVGIFNDGGGGGGAGLGGAIFMRSGTLVINQATFSNNSTTGGPGALNKNGEAQARAGQGKGGAVFICTAANHASCNATTRTAGVTFSGNSAANDLGSATDNDNVYGTLAGGDVSQPTVTINQAAGQADPATSNPVLFSAVFSEPVSGFTGSDVALSGTADRSGATITISGGPSTYSISVNGLAGNGTVIASIAANVATDAAGNGNTAATSTDNTVTFNSDSTPPVITPNVVGTPGANGWYVSNVTVSWTVADSQSTISNQTGCGTQSITSDTSGVTITCSATSAGGSSSQSVTIKRDATAPTITFVDRTAANPNGWNNSAVTVNWSCSDATSGAVAASVSQTVSGEGANQSATGACTDNAGNSASATQSGINIDQTAPTISAAATTGPNTAGWYNSDVTVQFTCADNLSGVTNCPADETLSSEGSTVSSTAQTITDLAGNSSAASNVVTVQIDKTAPVVTVTGVSAGASYPLGSVPAAGCSTSDALSGVATQAALNVTGGNGDGTGSFTATCSGASDNAGNSGSASVSYTVTAAADACTTTALRDNFNRADGSLGSNWAGLTNQSFYKIASNRVDVQLGGPVVWKPTTFGVNQAAFVTLSTLDPFSPSQGLLLKVQSGTIPNGGAIAVVYDNLAKAVRVSTLRLNTPAWTTYGNTPVTLANGDKLVGCVQANGTVRVYQNNTLLTTVTLNAADQSFFNAKGGKIGLWTVAAPNAFFDDFGGGALTGVSSATLDATVADEVADDGAELTVAVDFPTDDAAGAPDDAATNPDAGSLLNRAFLPLVSR